jgi:hypothetical protein
MDTMTLSAVGPRLAGTMALASAVLAGAAIWLLVTQPAVVTSALADGSVERLLRAVVDVIGGAIGRLLQLV